MAINVHPAAPRKQSFGEKISGVVGAGAQALGQYAEQKNQAYQHQQENQALLKKGIDLSGIKDPKMRQAYIDMALQAENKKAEQERQFGHDINKQNQQQQFDINKQTSQQYFEGQEANAKRLAEGEKPTKEDIKTQDEARIKDTAQKSFNGLVDILKKGNVGSGGGYGTSFFSKFPGETSKDVGKFQSLSGGIESMLVDMVSRGALSQSRFEYITKTLIPTPTDNADTIQGKLEGLAEILGLDASALNQKKNNKSSQAGKPANKQSLQDIFG
jgi:hypothetical protein